MNSRIAYIAIAALFLFGSGVTSFAATKQAPKKRVLTTAEKKIAGTYRCRSYNVSGGGGNCRIAPPLVLSVDGTYSMSSEKGTFRIAKKKLLLSGSKLRGAGTLSTQPSTIIFSYLYKGWRHTISYQKIDAAGDAASRTHPPAGGAAVPVELTIHFLESDGSVDWINVITLVPDGQTPQNAPYHPESLAVQEGKGAIHASFYGAKEVRAGTLYGVYASSGFETRKVGMLDLTNAKGLVLSVITAFPVMDAALPELQAPASLAPAPVLKQPSASVEQPPSPVSPPSQENCNPSLPHYAGGC